VSADDLRDEIGDLRALIKAIDSELDCAETAETDADVIAGVKAALTEAKRAVKALSEALS
jgi:DNA-binding FrmR family transcriptional regulator